MAIEGWAPGDPRGDVARDPRTEYADEPRASGWAPNDPRAPATEPGPEASAAPAPATRSTAPALAAPAAGGIKLPTLTPEQLQLAKMAAGVALAHKGRWPKLDSTGTNVNVLNSGQRTDMGESSSVHGTLVRITPV